MAQRLNRILAKVKRKEEARISLRDTLIDLDYNTLIVTLQSNHSEVTPQVVLQTARKLISESSADALHEINKNMKYILSQV